MAGTRASKVDYSLYYVTGRELTPCSVDFFESLEEACKGKRMTLSAVVLTWRESVHADVPLLQCGVGWTPLRRGDRRATA